ncbi:PREDICTED: calcium channel flower isoform X3 [Acromyrmex echinatior]|uniref:calcium channel flower isoform X3 n=1 Tax=Acromyrmex echinatior TaxID=103372 RepID=UPI000580FBC2|nr:PREDICTED: calcium channel flower isoform X3 [Acromyrmex echinatior]
MSFGEKIASIMQRPGQDPVAKDDVPWWMKYAGRGLGTVGSIIAIFLGAWNCASILFGQIDCLISGMWQMIAGFLVVMIEAPCCCLFIDFVQNLSDWVEKKPYWNRAAVYCLGSRPDPAGRTSGVGSPQGTVPPTADHHTTLMEDPDVWRPT